MLIRNFDNNQKLVIYSDYKESREEHSDDEEREDHTPLDSSNYFERGSSIMATTTTSPGAMQNQGYVYVNF